MNRRINVIVLSTIFVITLSALSFSQQTETLTITTYYPSPFGSYRELRSQRMAVGTTYYDAGTYPWDEGGGCLVNEICNADLVVEGNVGIGTIQPKTKLHIYGAPVEPGGNTTWRGQLTIQPDLAGLNPRNAYMAFVMPNGQTAGWVGYNSLNSLYAGNIELGSYPIGFAYPTPIVFTTDGVERMRIMGGGNGNVGIGTPSPSRKLEVDGMARINQELSANTLVVTYGGGTGGDWNVGGVLAGASGGANIWTVNTLNATTINTATKSGGPGVHGGHLQDIAEDFRAIDCEPADVVVINPDDNESVVKSKQSYDTTVAGVISQEPAFRIGKTDKDGYSPLALAGRVLCKVSTEGGPIKRGDLLVTSSKPGYAMKAEPDKLKPGMVLGKALETLDEAEGKILVLVTLQ